ncbi:MAG: hypothetical protein ACJATI_003080 [Halioglobus sp.]|jgi:hypothetical protein
MKKFYFALITFMFFAVNINAQDMTLDELKAKKTELAAKAGKAQATADKINGEIGGLQKEIDILSGWTKGISGNIGLNLNSSNTWIAAPNPTSSSTGLGVGLAAFANKMTDKTMLRNKGILNLAWQKVDLNDGSEVKGLFDSGTLDLLNISSLYGYRIHPKFAISALGGLNSSLFNFLKPGALDIGVGGTWTPSNNLVVVVHPLNYHYAWAADGTGVDASGALGLKVRADYTNSYVVLGKKIGLSSTFTTFKPYSDVESTFNAGEPNEYQAGLFEYTWLNTISFELWRGIGVGIGAGLRGADFEIIDETQTYYNFGLAYGF